MAAWFIYIVIATQWLPQYIQLTHIISYRFNKKKEEKKISCCDENSVIFLISYSNVN